MSAERGPSPLATAAARGTLQLTAAHAALMAASYGVAIVLARELGSARYGVYGIVYSVLLGVELIGRLGVPQAMSRLVPERGAGSAPVERTGVTLTALIYVPLFVVFWIGAPVLARLFHVRDGAELFRIASLDIPFFGLYFVGSHILNGRRSFGSESAGVAVYAAGKVVGIVALLAAGVTILGALLVNVFSSLAALAFVALRVGRSSWRPTLRGARAVIRVAIPVGLFSIGARLLASLDLWVLNALGTQVSDAVKGHYVAATTLARVANVASFVMAGVLIPSIARAIAEDDHATVRRSLRGAGRFLVALLIPGCAIAIADAPSIMSLVFSDEYRGGARLLRMLVVSHGGFYTLFVSLGVMLIGAKAEREAASIALGSVPLAGALGAVLVRLAGAPGAAAAAILATALAASVAAVRVRQKLGPVVAPALLARAVAVALPLGVVAWWIPAEGPALLLELTALGALYLAALFGLGLARREDVALLFPRRG